MTEPLRVVSLIPNGTEILVSLGLSSEIVGVSHECDYPPWVQSLPRLTKPKMNCGAPSAKIHQDVVAHLQNALSLYDLDFKLLKALQPDLIVTQDQCKVCAVSLSEVEAAVQGLTLNKTRVLSLAPHSLSDLFQDIRHLGSALKKINEATSLIQKMEERLRSVSNRVAPLVQPKVLCIEWLDPPMVAGGWIPELVKIAGGQPLIVERPEHFVTTDWPTLTASGAEKVVLFPCGFRIAKTLQELGERTVSNALKNISCVTERNCFIVDGNAFLNRAGPRLVESAEILAAIFHPEIMHELRAKYQNEIVPWPPKVIQVRNKK